MHWHWTPPEQIVNGLPAIVLAGLCLLIGAVFVFWGWKIFRVALALMGALVGWAVGLAIAAPLGAWRRGRGAAAGHHLRASRAVPGASRRVPHRRDVGRAPGPGRAPT